MFFEPCARHGSERFSCVSAGRLDDPRNVVVVFILWTRKLKFSHFLQVIQLQVAWPASPCLILRLSVSPVPQAGAPLSPFPVACLCPGLRLHSSLAGLQTKTESCPRTLHLLFPHPGVLPPDPWSSFLLVFLTLLRCHLVRLACFKHNS